MKGNHTNYKEHGTPGKVTCAEMKLHKLQGIKHSNMGQDAS